MVKNTAKEIEFAKLNCKELNVKHEVVNLELEKILSNSALVGDTEIPEGNYDKEKMKQTIVPNRNMIMISVAASLAIKNNIEYLWYAAHSEIMKYIQIADLNLLKKCQQY